jgi:phage terminase small subunit
MAKVSIDIASELAKDNPQARAAVIAVYADSLRIYCEAADNVATHGAVVLHPKTAAPLENPYLKIQERQAKILRSMPRIDGGRVLYLVQDYFAAQRKESNEEAAGTT